MIYDKLFVLFFFIVGVCDVYIVVFVVLVFGVGDKFMVVLMLFGFVLCFSVVYELGELD